MVKDTVVNEHNGTFVDWKLTLWGECIDASKQDLLPMPTEHDDDDHGVESAVVSTATISSGTEETNLAANPTDHITRPVNVKPTDGPPKPVTTSATPTTAAASSPSTTAGKNSEHFLPHYFPTFGVSKRTQIWIYGALAIIVLFCAGLGTYFFVQRSRRIRNSRDAYEFDVLDDADAGAGLTGASSGRRPRRRAGELYDAFAGESDDEELLSDSDTGPKAYRDDEVGSEDEGRRGSEEGVVAEK